MGKEADLGRVLKVAGPLVVAENMSGTKMFEVCCSYVFKSIFGSRSYELVGKSLSGRLSSWKGIRLPSRYTRILRA